jgi:hypothetical protein
MFAHSNAGSIFPLSAADQVTISDPLVIHFYLYTLLIPKLIHKLFLKSLMTKADVGSDFRKRQALAFPFRMIANPIFQMPARYISVLSNGIFVSSLNEWHHNDPPLRFERL